MEKDPKKIERLGETLFHAARDWRSRSMDDAGFKRCIALALNGVDGTPTSALRNGNTTAERGSILAVVLPGMKVWIPNPSHPGAFAAGVIHLDDDGHYHAEDEASIYLLDLDEREQCWCITGAAINKKCLPQLKKLLNQEP